MSEHHKNAAQTLVDAAFAAQQRAYTPYSHFNVGAAIVADDMQTYAGCNVENISYPLGQCAEASAISAMILAGGRKIREVVIASPNNEFCPPCGGCRQKIKEFADADTLVHLVTQDGRQKSMLISELLPLAFDSL